MFEIFKNKALERAAKKAEKKHSEHIADAESIYQLREYHGELWLTYDTCLVCPCSMLKDEPVESVAKMRVLYVDRKGV